MNINMPMHCIGIGNATVLWPARIMGFAMESAAEVLSLMNRTELLKVYLVERKAAVPLSVHLSRWEAD